MNEIFLSEYSRIFQKSQPPATWDGLVSGHSHKNPTYTELMELGNKLWQIANQLSDTPNPDWSRIHRIQQAASEVDRIRHDLYDKLKGNV